MPVIGSQYYVLSTTDQQALYSIGAWGTVSQYFHGPVGGYYYANPDEISTNYELFDLFDEAGVGFAMGNYIYSNQWQFGV